MSEAKNRLHLATKAFVDAVTLEVNSLASTQKKIENDLEAAINRLCFTPPSKSYYTYKSMSMTRGRNISDAKNKLSLAAEAYVDAATLEVDSLQQKKLANEMKELNRNLTKLSTDMDTNTGRLDELKRIVEQQSSEISHVHDKINTLNHNLNGIKNILEQHFKNAHNVSSEYKEIKSNSTEFVRDVLQSDGVPRRPGECLQPGDITANNKIMKQQLKLQKLSYNVSSEYKESKSNGTEFLQDVLQSDGVPRRLGECLQTEEASGMVPQTIDSRRVFSKEELLRFRIVSHRPDDLQDMTVVIVSRHSGRSQGGKGGRSNNEILPNNHSKRSAKKTKGQRARSGTPLIETRRGSNLCSRGRDGRWRTEKNVDFDGPLSKPLNGKEKGCNYGFTSSKSSKR